MKDKKKKSERVKMSKTPQDKTMKTSSKSFMKQQSDDPNSLLIGATSNNGESGPQQTQPDKKTT